jgi:CRP-like cAMP-binding protein
VTDGHVNLVHKKTKTKIKELGVDNFFGEISFFSNKPRAASAKCLGFAEILSLEKDDFDNLCLKNKDAREAKEEIEQ